MQLIACAERKPLRHRLNALAVARTDQSRHVERAHLSPCFVTQPIQKRLEPTSELVSPIRRPANHGSAPPKSRPPMSHRKSDLGIPCPRKICQSSARACTHKATTLIDVRIAPHKRRKSGTFPNRRFAPKSDMCTAQQTAIISTNNTGGCNASDPQCPGRAYRRLYSHRRPFDLDDSQEFGGLDAAAQSKRRYRACRGPAGRHDLTPPVWVDWPLRPRDSRMGHHLCGVAGEPASAPGRQGAYFRSSSLACDDDYLHAPGRQWFVRAVARVSGDGGDACSSPHLRCGSGCGLRQGRP